GVVITFWFYLSDRYIPKIVGRAEYKKKKNHLFINSRISIILLIINHNTTLTMSLPKVLIPMSDYGHDPTETAVPYHTFKTAGFSVHSATETGGRPACDIKMLEGITQKLLGATQATASLYKEMSQTDVFTSPLSWSSESFFLKPYHLVFLPNNNEKGYWKGVKKPGKKCIGAVCHGVMVLSESMMEGNDGAEKKSIIHDCDTTSLPGMFEGMAYWSTRWVLGDYYKTYGAGSENVEASIMKRLDDPERQWKQYLLLNPFVVEDENYNYMSARWPGDVQLLADRLVDLVRENVNN
ncbi:c657ce8f-666b-4f2e-b5a8-f0621ed304f0, partial [Sclerotinia trifoliorum]